MRRAVLVPLFLALLAPMLSAADNADAKERTRQALLYGIDSQVLETIQSIAKTQDQGFTPELARILSAQRSVDVRKAVLDLFRDQKVKDGESAAREILAGWQDLKPTLTAARGRR
jgi:hypothetical protein